MLSLLLDQGVAQQLQQQAAAAAGEAAMAEADTLLAAGTEAEQLWVVDLAGDLMAQVGWLVPLWAQPLVAFLSAVPSACHAPMLRVAPLVQRACLLHWGACTALLSRPCCFAVCGAAPALAWLHLSPAVHAVHAVHAGAVAGDEHPFLHVSLTAVQHTALPVMPTFYYT